MIDDGTVENDGSWETIYYSCINGPQENDRWMDGRKE